MGLMRKIASSFWHKSEADRLEKEIASDKSKLTPEQAEKLAFYTGTMLNKGEQK